MMTKVAVLSSKVLSPLLFLVFIFFLSVSGSYTQNVIIEQKLEVKDYLENVHCVSEGVSARISWNLKYDKIPLKGHFVIRYLDENLTNLDASPKWNYTEKLAPETTSFDLKDLPSNEKMAYSIGIHLDGEPEGKLIWYKTKTFRTERSWVFGKGLGMRIFMLLGALALFIYGMIIMSEGIQKAAGQRLRNILGSITANPFRGIFTGLLTTSIVQSSSATTVMVVSFVNAGLLNLKQSISVIMGANIGTTVTAWLVAYLGFSISMVEYALPIFFAALLFIFINRGTIKAWGEFLAGFALLFIGLELLKSGVPDLKGNLESFRFLNDLTKHGFGSVLIFILIGAAITVVVQSSSAAMAVTILLCERGIIPFDMAAGMVLGENIGTTVTANLAAIVGNVHAKRAARSHFVFNVIGVAWMILVFTPFLFLIDYLVSLMGYLSPLESQSSRPVALALFHTLFNVLNVLLLVWFTKYIAQIVVRMVPARRESDEEFRLEYIAGGLLATPELSILEAKKEIVEFAERTAKMNQMFKELLFEKDNKKKKKLYERIEKYERITDSLRIEIIEYLSHCAEEDISNESQQKVLAYMAISNELERIADIYYQMSLVYKRKDEEMLYFTPEQRNSVKEMLEQLDLAFKTMIINLMENQSDFNFEAAVSNERRIDGLRNKLRSENDLQFDSENFNVKGNVIYTDLIFSCERIGDLIMNVSKELKLKKL